MAALRMGWTPLSKTQFEELSQRVIGAGKYEKFRQAHNEIAIALRDLTQAMDKGELLYNTRRPKGEVRHWIHQFISVCYVVFPKEQIGWILRYKPVPDSWPEGVA